MFLINFLYFFQQKKLFWTITVVILRSKLYSLFKVFLHVIYSFMDSFFLWDYILVTKYQNAFFMNFRYGNIDFAKIEDFFID